MFADRLIESIKAKNSCVVAGLDPRIEYIPSQILKKAFNYCGTDLKCAAQAIYDFNKGLIDSIYDVVPAVKLQSAYYEMYGADGVKAFYKTANYAKKKGLLVIADAKRNDIGTTAQAYSSAFIGKISIEGTTLRSVLDADAVTVNPYLGIDGIKPFIEDCNKYRKGIFILVKTSNKSSGQIQDLVTKDGKTIYEIVANHVEEWGASLIGKNGYSSIGAVVGATYPNQAKELRSVMKHAYILVPGYGAQGGTAEDAANSFNEDGLGAIINASRSIMCAYKADIWKDKYTENQFAEAARAETIRMRDEINIAVKKQFKG
ncbi:MAG: orotidine-5'-phosphate decarboxylase [Clostridia bacterium]|jgi:orotidine-5'-phosphate decarboxylase